MFALVPNRVCQIDAMPVFLNVIDCHQRPAALEPHNVTNLKLQLLHPSVVAESKAPDRSKMLQPVRERTASRAATS